MYEKFVSVMKQHFTLEKRGHDVQVRVSENPHTSLQQIRARMKVNMVCAMTSNKVYGPFFSVL
jgi:hypothetical protein